MASTQFYLLTFFVCLWNSSSGQNDNVFFEISSSDEHLINFDNFEDFNNDIQVFLDELDPLYREDSDDTGTKPRRKRDFDSNLELEFKLDILEVFLENLQVFRMFYLNDGKLMCVIRSEKESHMYAIQLNEKRVFFKLVAEVPSVTPYLKSVDMIQVISKDSKVWIVEANYISNLLVISKMSLELDEVENNFQQIQPLGGKISSIHLMELENEIFLAVMVDPESERKSRSMLLKLHGDHFIEFTSIPDVSKAVTSFSSYQFGHLSIMTFVQRNMKASIWTFDPSSKKIEHLLDLKENIIQLKSFKDKNDKDSLAVASLDGLKVYQWASADNFTLVMKNFFQFSYPLKSLGSMENELFIVTENKLKLYEYVDNTLHFKADVSSPCNDVSQLQTIQMHQKILVTIECRVADQNRSDIYFIVKNRALMQKDDSTVAMTDFELCLDELNDALEMNKPFIQEMQDLLSQKLLVKSDGSEQVLTKRVEFDSLNVKNDIKASDLILKTPPELQKLISKIYKMSSRTINLMRESKNIEAKIDNLLTFTGNNQRIRASVSIDQMVAENANIYSLAVNRLNDTSISDYKTKYLKIIGDQTLYTDVRMDKVIAKDISVDSISNGKITLIPQDLFEQNNPNQRVTGSHSFSSIEVLDSISRYEERQPIRINGISSKELVLKDVKSDSHSNRKLEYHQNPKFANSKVFLKPILVEDSLQIININGNNFDSWRNSILKFNPQSMIDLKQPLVVRGNVHVVGNVKAMSINGVDVNDLFQRSAKKSSTFSIVEGPVEFTDTIEIDTLNVVRVNDVNWNDYLRLSNSTVKAQFHIDKALVSGNVESDSINGINLSEDAVLIEGDQTITGDISFMYDVEVSGVNGVTMDPGATINGIDPTSNLALVSGSNHTFFDIPFNFHGHVIQTKADIHVNRMRGVPYNDLHTKYWKKSSSQRIPGDVYIKSVNFEKSLFAKELNGRHLDDFLRYNKKQTLTGRNYFTQTVFVDEDLKLKDGKTVSGSHLSDIRDQAITLDEEQTIEGVNIFERGMEVKDLHVFDGILGGIDVNNDFVYGNSSMEADWLQFSGPVFTDKLKISKSLRVNSINGEEPDVVLNPKIQPISEIKGDLIVDYLQVEDLKVSGKLNNVDFDHWINRVVPKDSFDSLIFTNSTILKGTITFAGPITLKTVNSKRLDDYFDKIATTCEGCIIGGTKTFELPLNILGNLDVETVNGINLRDLKTRILSRTEDQTITGKYSFKSNVAAVRVKTPEISGIKISDIALVDEETELTGLTTFHGDVEFNHISSNSGWIDGCNIDAVFNPVTIKPGNLMSANVSLGHLKVLGDITADKEILNGAKNFDVLNFLSNVVRKSEEQTIVAPSEFKGFVTIQSGSMSQINGISFDELWMKLAANPSTKKLQCDVKFSDELSIDNFQVNDVTLLEDLMINSLNINDVMESGIKKNNQKKIFGRKTFVNITVEGNIKVKNISNIPISDFVEIENQHFGKHLNFISAPKISGPINVKGLIANEEPSDMFRPFENTKNEAYPSIFPPKYNSITVKGDLVVDSINDLAINDIISTYGEEQTIEGPKTIEGGIVIYGEAEIDTINDIDLKHFGEWSDVHLQTFSDEQLRTLFETGPGQGSNEAIMTQRDYLETSAFRVRRLNQMNFQRARNLYQELMAVSLVGEITVPGVYKFLPHERADSSEIFIIVQKDKDCQRLRTCPCLSTHKLMVRMENLSASIQSYPMGLYFAFKVPEFPKSFYDVVVPCMTTAEPQTTIRLVDVSRNFLSIPSFSLGFIQEMLHFEINNKLYLVSLSKIIGSLEDEFHELNVILASNRTEIIWKERLNILATDMAIQKVFKDIYLVVGGNYNVEAVAKNVQSESQIFKWDESIGRFNLENRIEPASTVEIIEMDRDYFMFLGQNRISQSVRDSTMKDRSLKVYKKSSPLSDFVPFKSLPMEGIIDTSSFLVGSDLFVAALSSTEGCVKVFKLMKMESFQEVTNYAFENPTSVTYFLQNRKRFLMVASSGTTITVLQLHFEGVNGRLVMNPY